MDLIDLRKPFDPDRVSWRVGSTTADKTRGMALAYIDSRDVQDRLDEVCGIQGWQCRYSSLGKTTICEIGVRVGEEWIWKADGAGDTDVEAEKGALSDAFKRAAVKFGIGRYLYDLDSPWVEIKQFGKSYGLTDAAKTQLRTFLSKGTAPSSATATPAAKPPAAKSSAPAPEAPSNTKAVLWAKAAIVSVRGMSREALDAWEEKNNATIVKLRTEAPEQHTNLIETIRNRYAILHPINAG